MPVGTATICPLPKMQLFTDAGLPAVGYQLFCYVSGTTTKQDTYQDATFTAANTNPIILDSAGRATVFLDALSYKFVLADPTDTDPPTGATLWTVDGVQGVPQQAGNVDVVGVAGENLTAGDIVYIYTSDGKWMRSIATSAAASVDATAVGVVITGGLADAAVIVRISGRLTTAAALTAGSTYYLSTNIGVLVTPANTANCIRAFGVADTIHTIVFPVTETYSAGIRTAKKVFAYSSGQGCTTGAGTDDELTSYRVPIPPGYLNAPGDALLVEGTYVLAANGNAKVGKIRVEAGTLVTLYTGTGNAHIIPFRVLIRRRTSTTGSMTGITWVGAAAGGAPTNYLVNSAVTVVDWTALQTLYIYANGAAADIILTDYTVSRVAGYASATV
jgi:hypothetical protein